jgi:hypothetical protein
LSFAEALARLVIHVERVVNFEVPPWLGIDILFCVSMQYCSFVKTHASGYGTMNFHMVNMRGVYQFALFRGGTSVVGVRIRGQSV